MSTAPNTRSFHVTRGRIARIAAAVLVAAPVADVSAQQFELPKRDRPNVNSFAIMSGLSQPILFRGANLEIEYLTRNFVLGWSHGANLQIDQFKSGLSEADRAASIGLKMPWTTGPSVGVRLANRLNLTVDFKAHRVNATMPGGERGAYTVYTIGPALGYMQPLGSRLFIQPFLRWWPTVGTSLDDNKLALRAANGSRYTHQALDLGIVPNVKIGYRF